MDTITFFRDENGEIRWRYTLAGESSAIATSVPYSQLDQARRDAFRVAGLDPADPSYTVKGNTTIRRRGTTSSVATTHENNLA